MSETSRYEEGQRWTYQPTIPEFEGTLVIGRALPPRPEWGRTESEYTVYVQFSQQAKPFIPPDYDGTNLKLNDEGLDRSVGQLVESNVELPWWWVYGRRFKSQDDAPRGQGVLCCDRVSDVLAHEFRSAKEMAEEIAARKEALQRHREKFPAGADSPPRSQSVAESWQRIEAWFTEHAEPLGSQLAPGATPAAIDQFEAAIGARLPDDFRESVLIHDGGDWWVPPYHGDLLSLERILEEWKMYCDWQENGEYAIDDDDGWNPTDIEGPIKPVFWNRRRIYVTDNSGDHLTLDLDPPAEGTYGQVIDHSHEVGPTKVLGAGWGDFLASLVQDLESGRFVYLPHTGGIEPLEEVEQGPL